MKFYYYSKDGKQFGPFTVEELKSERITRSTLVWREGIPDWVKACDINELEDVLIPEPPPIPIPKETQIGNQIWNVKNLDVGLFRNGNLIPHAKSRAEWQLAGRKCKPAWCYYDNKSFNSWKYGKLYNWYAVIDPRGLAPLGWKIPSDLDWSILIDFLGGEKEAGIRLKSTCKWIECPSGGIPSGPNGTNESGFSGYPAGFRHDDGLFDFFGVCGFWWLSDSASIYGTYRCLVNFDSSIEKRSPVRAGLGFSVRCLKE